MTAEEKIVAHFGPEHQLKKTAEELMELVLAIQHYLGGRNNREEIIEEMGDAENMLSQMRRILKIDLNEIEAVIRQKEERTIEIIGEENAERNNQG